MSSSWHIKDEPAPAKPAAPFTIAAPEQQIQIGVADTPAGQRLAIVVTTLLEPAAAKQLADAIGQATGAIPASRIVLANGVLPR